MPLPFLALDKPQVSLVSRRPPSLSSGGFTEASSARPNSNSAESPTVKPAPASTTVMGPQKPLKTISASATRHSVANPTLSSSVSHLAASRPAPYKMPSYKSLQKKPGPGDQSKDQAPPKSQSQNSLQDFSCQPIPWRKVTIPGPVISHPITTAQRPEREAMKRQAQQERERTANDSALRKLKVFLQREEDMEISHYYGYVM